MKIGKELKKVKKAYKKAKKAYRKAKEAYKKNRGDCAPVSVTSPSEWLLPTAQTQELKAVPFEMILRHPFPSGFIFGMKSGFPCNQHIGLPHGTEGNIIVIGGNGSGKSASIAKPTILNWEGAMCVTDVKGELSKAYADAYQVGKNRPYLIFDPMCPDGPSYDPFGWLLQDDEKNLISNIREIVLEILPDLQEVKEPFWCQTEQAVFEAALLYCFKLGLSFSEAVCKILKSTLSALCEEMLKAQDVTIQILLGEISTMKPETLADVDRGLRNKLMCFAADPYISHAFRGEREGAKSFTWQDMERYNIFLRIPAERIEQWGRAINLMYAQLLRYLERRTDRYDAGVMTNIQTLLLMDEFPRFGKLEMILPAISTLRSKNINICLMVQSLAQLDRLYGTDGRRIILDNCQYQAILRSNDAETQQYLSNLIGVDKTLFKSASCHLDEFMDSTGYSEQVSEGREPRVFPHELATLNDVLLLTPDGFFRLDKIPPDYDFLEKQASPSPAKVKVFVGKPLSEIVASAEKQNPQPGHTVFISSTALEGGNRLKPVPLHLTETSSVAASIPPENEMRNVGAKMLTIEERIENAEQRCSNYLRQERDTARKERMKMDKNDKRRNYILGELVSKHFPAVRNLEPGTMAENAKRFKSFESILIVLADDPELMENLKERAQRVELE